MVVTLKKKTQRNKKTLKKVSKDVLKNTKKDKKEGIIKNILKNSRKHIDKFYQYLTNSVKNESEHFSLYESIYELGSLNKKRILKIINFIDKYSVDNFSKTCPERLLGTSTNCYNDKKNIFEYFNLIQQIQNYFKKIKDEFSKFNDNIKKFNDKIISLNNAKIKINDLERIKKYLFLVSSIYLHEKELFNGQTLEKMLIKNKQPKIKITSDNFHNLGHRNLFLINPCYKNMHQEYNTFRSSFGVATPLFLVLKKNRELIITVQGTWRYMDFLSDFNGKSILFSKIFEKKKIPHNFKSLGDCYVHEQLAKNAFKIYELILNILPSKKIKNIDKISICGHSMGGTISTLLGLLIYFYLLSKRLKISLKIYTFNTSSTVNNDASTQKIRNIILKNNKSKKNTKFQIKNIFYRQDPAKLFNLYSLSVFISILLSTKLKKNAENYKFFLDKIKDNPKMKFQNELLEPFYVNKNKSGIITDNWTFLNKNEYIEGDLPFLFSFYVEDHHTSNLYSVSNNP